MRSVGLLLLSIGVVGSNSLVLSPISGEISLSFDGVKSSEVMLASAIYGASTALSALFLAPQADRWGLRRSLLFALCGLTLAFIISATANSLVLLCVGQALAGLAAGLALPATYGLAAVIAPAGKESATLGKVLVGWTLSLVFGVTLSAVIADLVHWRAVFGLLAAVTLAVAFNLSRLQIQGDRPNQAASNSPVQAAKIPGVPALLIGVASYMVAFYGLYAYLGTHLQQGLGLSTSIIGLAALSYGIGFGLATPLDRIIDRVSAPIAAPFIFVALALNYLVLSAMSASAAGLILSCALWGMVNHLGVNLLVARLAAAAPRQRASVLGLYSSVTYAAMFAGTAVYRPLFEGWGFGNAALVSAALIIPGILSCLPRRLGGRAIAHS